MLFRSIAGRMKSHFAGFDYDFELGTPIFVTGAQHSLRYRASRPALVLSLGALGQRLWVSFGFDTLDASRLVGSDRPAAAELGAMQFL